MKKALMFLLLILYSGIAFTAYVDGNVLLSNCENDLDVVQGHCIGYITGVADTSKGKTHEGNRYCVPEGVLAGQLKKIITKYLNDNPKNLHLSAFSLVQDALIEAFPCE